MATEVDLWQAAQWALDHHGDGADWIANRIEALAAAGDTAGVVAWTSVLGKLSELQCVQPKIREVAH